MLNKNLQGVSATFDTEGDTIILEGNGWSQLAHLMLVQRDYFDMSGYNRKSLTTFFQGVEQQYAGPPTNNVATLQILDFVSTEFLTDAELIATLGNVQVLSGPGFTLSTNNQEQIIYARRRTYTLPTGTTTTAVTTPVAHSVDLWGTCSATTADKLHITRVVITASGPSALTVSDVNIVVTAIIAEEKDLTFLMRQKRSYEIATGP